MTDDEFTDYLSVLWSETLDRLEHGLPVASYEKERWLARVQPILEQTTPGTVH